MQKFTFDLQRFANINEQSDINALKLLINVITKLGLKTLADELRDVKDKTEWLKKNANPVLKFIGTFWNATDTSNSKSKVDDILNIFARSISILDSTHAIFQESVKDNVDKTEIKKEVTFIASEFTEITKSFVKLNSSKNTGFLVIIAAGLGLTSSIIASANGVDAKEKDKISETYAIFMKSISKEVVKKLFADGSFDEFIKLPVNQILNTPTLKTEMRKQIADNFTKGGGPLDLIFAAINGIINGIDRYGVTFKKYTADGIPEDMAKRDAFIDAITTVIHDTAHTYTKGVDDVIFKGTQTLVSLITGKKPGSHGNYVEVITDLFKAFNFKNSGTADGDYLLSFEDNMLIYGMDGNDYIGNMFSNVTIYAGHDDDTIVSRTSSANGNSTPQGNNFFGGPGKDLIMVYDTGSTIDGGADSDRIGVLGTRNKIYGGDGIDAILLENGANGNTVSGGLGNDAISFENVKNAVIEYNEGDGNDIIFGYDESDTIRINGSYSTKTSGQDVIIVVGNSLISLVGAAGKNININNKKSVIGENQSGGSNSFYIVPSFWHDGAKVIRGTNGNDTINNTLDNLIINALAGKDDIANSGSNIIITSGNGYDYITNSGNNVTINGSKGSDNITNYGSNVVINDGQVVQNLSSNVTISNSSDYYGLHYYESINNSGTNVVINGGSIVHNEGSNVTISNDYGEYLLYNSGNSVSIYTGKSNDSIGNSGADVTISAGDGNNDISNGGANTTIYSGAGNDSIRNLGSNVLIQSNDGDNYIENGRIYYFDTIKNCGTNITIQSGLGKDSIENLSDNVSISSGAGKDTIYNWGSLVTIDGGNGNDYIYNGNGTDQGIYVKINANLGDDTIRNNSSNVMFIYTAGDGNDIIFGFNKTSTLKIIGASYSSVKSGSDVIVTVGNGKITLQGAANLSNSAVITTPPDTTPTALNLNNTKKKSKVTGSAYDDTITNSGSNVTISGGTGGDSVQNSGATVSVDGGADSDTIDNNGNKVTISGVGGDDDIYNYGDSVKINGGTGNDNIMNYGAKVTVDGGAGNDFLYSNASDVSINAGDGSDTIINYGDKTAISGGKGNDAITNTGANVRFKYTAGDGNDLIEGFNETSTLQIGDGKGTYSFTVSGDDAIVTVGDGKITLQGAASLSAVHVDGTGSTVPPAATAPLNLTNKLSYKTINGTSYNDSVWNEGDSVTVNAAAGNDSIVNTGDNFLLNAGDGNDYVSNILSRYVTINGGTGSDSINNVANGFVKIDAGAGNDSIYSFSDYATITGGTGNDTVSLNTSGGHNVIEYASGDGNDIVYNLASTDTLKITNGSWFSVVNGDDVLVNVDSGTITLSGAKDKTVNIDGKKLTSVIVDDFMTIEFTDSWICQLVLYGSNINSSKNNALLTGTDYNDTIKNTGNTIFIRAGAGQDSIYNTGYALIEAGADSDTVTNYGNYATITGGDGKDSIYNRANAVVISGDAGNDNIYFSGQNSYIFGGTDNDSIYVTGSGNRIYAGNGSDTISISSSASAITIDGGTGDDVINGKGLAQTILYKAGDGNDLINGFKTNSTLQIGGGTSTYSTAKSGSDMIVTVGNGKITLQGAASLSNLNILGKKISTSAWSLNGTTATYGDSITVTGIKSLDGVSLNNKTVTISNTALNQGMITVSDGYILALADDVSKPSTSAATWTNKNGIYTYTAPKTSAGYSLSGKKISYVAASGGDKFTIAGLKNTSAVTVSGKKVTVGNASLNSKAVTLTGAGYTLAVDNSVSTKATTAKAAWTKKNSTFTYTAPITSDFYTLKGNTLNYTAKKGGEQFTLTGLKNTNAVTVSGKKVTIGNNSLDGKAVTLTGDYTLALAKDVTTSAKKTAGAFTTVSKGTATYKTTSFGGYYKVSGKKISFTAPTGGQSITIKNLNIATKLSALKSGVTVAEQSNGSYKITFKNASVLTTKAPTVSAAKGLKYTVAVADSLKPVTKSAWTVSGTTATFCTTTTAGYSVNSKNAVVYSAQKTGSPLIELTGMVKGVKASSIAAPKNKIVTLNANVLGKNASLKSNGGGYTINLSGNMSGKKFTGTGKVDTLTVAANNANVDLGAGNDVVTVSGLKVTLNGGSGNDKLTGSKNVDLLYGGAGNDSILGNAANDKLYGDAGNDTLRGGSGNDTLTGGKGDDKLWGDAGKDTFLYSNGDGKDVIFGFENNDLLQITGVFSASYNKSKKEIAFKVGSTANAITLKDFTATSFHINGDTYGISGTKLVKK